MRAAIWARVSTTEQEMENQLRQLREAAARRGLEVVEPVYVAEASAWKGRHRVELDRALLDARAGRYDVPLCWALDRLTREGPLETLQVVDRFAKAGVQVVSLQESWTDAAGELRDLLLAIVGWVAGFESVRRSERTRAGLERARSEGKPLGRREKVETFAAAQRDQLLDHEVEAADLVLFVIALAAWWVAVPQLARLVTGSRGKTRAERARRRAAVVEAARRLGSKPGTEAGQARLFN